MRSTTYQFTRSEVAKFVRDTFDTLDIVERKDVLKALYDQGAPQEMIDAVAAHVPEETRMTDMRVLWVYLRDVPLGGEPA